MNELYYWPTPNGHKITIFCEEAGIPYTIKPIDIQAGEQFQPDFISLDGDLGAAATEDRGFSPCEALARYHARSARGESGL